MGVLLAEVGVVAVEGRGAIWLSMLQGQGKATTYTASHHQKQDYDQHESSVS